VDFIILLILILSFPRLFTGVKMNNSSDKETENSALAAKSHKMSYQPRRLPDNFNRVGNITLFLFYFFCSIVTLHLFLMFSGNKSHILIQAGILWMPIVMMLCELCRRGWLFVRLPIATREEFLHGQIYHPFDGKESSAPQKFCVWGKWIEIRADALALPPSSMPWLKRYIYSFHKPYEIESGMWIIPWNHIIEVEVKKYGNDMGDVYWAYMVQMFAAHKAIIYTNKVDTSLLDAFRAVGRIPVRIKDDIN